MPVLPPGHPAYERLQEQVEEFERCKQALLDQIAGLRVQGAPTGVKETLREQVEAFSQLADLFLTADGCRQLNQAINGRATIDSAHRVRSERDIGLFDHPLSDFKTQLQQALREGYPVTERQQERMSLLGAEGDAIVDGISAQGVSAGEAIQGAFTALQEQALQVVRTQYQIMGLPPGDGQVAKAREVQAKLLTPGLKRLQHSPAWGKVPGLRVNHALPDVGFEGVGREELHSYVELTRYRLTLGRENLAAYFAYLTKRLSWRQRRNAEAMSQAILAAVDAQLEELDRVLVNGEVVDFRFDQANTIRDAFVELRTICLSAWQDRGAKAIPPTGIADVDAAFYAMRDDLRDTAAAIVAAQQRYQEGTDEEAAAVLEGRDDAALLPGTPTHSDGFQPARFIGEPPSPPPLPPSPIPEAERINQLASELDGLIQRLNTELDSTESVALRVLNIELDDSYLSQIEPDLHSRKMMHLQVRIALRKLRVLERGLSIRRGSAELDQEIRDKVQILREELVAYQERHQFAVGIERLAKDLQGWAEVEHLQQFLPDRFGLPLATQELPALYDLSGGELCPLIGVLPAFDPAIPFSRLDNLYQRIWYAQVKLEQFLMAIGVPGEAVADDGLRKEFVETVLPAFNKVLDKRACHETKLNLLQAKQALDEVNIEELLGSYSQFQADFFEQQQEAIKAYFMGLAGEIGIASREQVGFAEARYQDCKQALLGLQVEQGRAIERGVTDQERFLLGFTPYSQADGVDLVAPYRLMAPYDASLQAIADGVSEIEGYQVDEVQQLLGQVPLTTSPVEVRVGGWEALQAAYAQMGLSKQYLSECLRVAREQGFGSPADLESLQAAAGQLFEEIDQCTAALGSLEQARYLLDYLAEPAEVDGERRLRTVSIGGREIEVDLCNPATVTAALNLILTEIHGQLGAVARLHQEFRQTVASYCPLYRRDGDEDSIATVESAVSDEAAAGSAASASSFETDSDAGAVAGHELSREAHYDRAMKQALLLDPENGVMAVALAEFERLCGAYEVCLAGFSAPGARGEALPVLTQQIMHHAAEVPGFYRYAQKYSTEAVVVRGADDLLAQVGGEAEQGRDLIEVDCNEFQPQVRSGDAVLVELLAFNEGDFSFTRLDEVSHQLGANCAKFTALIRSMVGPDFAGAGSREALIAELLERMRPEVDLLLSAQKRASCALDVGELLGQLDDMDIAAFDGRCDELRATFSARLSGVFTPPARDLEDWQDCRAIFNSLLEERRGLVDAAVKVQREYLTGALEFGGAEVVGRRESVQQIIEPGANRLGLALQLARFPDEGGAIEAVPIGEVLAPQRPLAQGRDVPYLRTLYSYRAEPRLDVATPESYKPKRANAAGATLLVHDIQVALPNYAGDPDFLRLENLKARLDYSRAKMHHFFEALGIIYPGGLGVGVMNQVNKVLDAEARGRTGLRMEQAFDELRDLNVDDLLSVEVAVQGVRLSEQENQYHIKATFRQAAEQLGIAAADQIAFVEARWQDCQAMLRDLQAEQRAVVAEVVASQRVFLGAGPEGAEEIRWRAGVASLMAPYDQSFERMRQHVAREVNRGVGEGGLRYRVAEVDRLFSGDGLVDDVPVLGEIAGERPTLAEVEGAHTHYSRGLSYLEACLNSDTGFYPLRDHLQEDLDQLKDRLAIIGSLKQQYQHLVLAYDEAGVRGRSARTVELNGVRVRVDLANPAAVQAVLTTIVEQVIGQREAVCELARGIYQKADDVRAAEADAVVDSPGFVKHQVLERLTQAPPEGQGLSEVAAQAKLDRMIGVREGVALYQGDELTDPQNGGQTCVMSVAMREFDRHFRVYQQRLDAFTAEDNAVEQLTARIQLGAPGFYRFYDAAAVAGGALPVPNAGDAQAQGREGGFADCASWRPEVQVGPASLTRVLVDLPEQGGLPVVAAPGVVPDFAVDEPSFARLDGVNARIDHLKARMQRFMQTIGLAPADLEATFGAARDRLDVLLSEGKRQQAGVDVERLLGRLDSTFNFVGSIPVTLDNQARLLSAADKEARVKAALEVKAVELNIPEGERAAWVNACYEDCQAIMRSFCEEQRELFRQAHREQRCYLGAPEFDYAADIQEGAVQLRAPQEGEEVNARRRIAERGLVAYDAGFRALRDRLVTPFGDELPAPNRVARVVAQDHFGFAAYADEDEVDANPLQMASQLLGYEGLARPIETTLPAEEQETTLGHVEDVMREYQRSLGLLKRLRDFEVPSGRRRAMEKLLPESLRTQVGRAISTLTTTLDRIATAKARIKNILDNRAILHDEARVTALIQAEFDRINGVASVQEAMRNLQVSLAHLKDREVVEAGGEDFTADRQTIVDRLQSAYGRQDGAARFRLLFGDPAVDLTQGFNFAVGDGGQNCIGVLPTILYEINHSAARLHQVQRRIAEPHTDSAVVRAAIIAAIRRRESFQQTLYRAFRATGLPQEQAQAVTRVVSNDEGTTSALRQGSEVAVLFAYYAARMAGYEDKHTLSVVRAVIRAKLSATLAAPLYAESEAVRGAVRMAVEAQAGEVHAALEAVGLPEITVEEVGNVFLENVGLREAVLAARADVNKNPDAAIRVACNAIPGQHANNPLVVDAVVAAIRTLVAEAPDPDSPEVAAEAALRALCDGRRQPLMLQRMRAHLHTEAPGLVRFIERSASAEAIDTFGNQSLLRGRDLGIVEVEGGHHPGQGDGVFLRRGQGELALHTARYGAHYRFPDGRVVGLHDPYAMRVQPSTTHYEQRNPVTTAQLTLLRQPDGDADLVGQPEVDTPINPGAHVRAKGWGRCIMAHNVQQPGVGVPVVPVVFEIGSDRQPVKPQGMSDNLFAYYCGRLPGRGGYEGEVAVGQRYIVDFEGALLARVLPRFYQAGDEDRQPVPGIVDGVLEPKHLACEPIVVTLVAGGYFPAGTKGLDGKVLLAQGQPWPGGVARDRCRRIVLPEGAGAGHEYIVDYFITEPSLGHGLLDAQASLTRRLTHLREDRLRYAPPAAADADVPALSAGQQANRFQYINRLYSELLSVEERQRQFLRPFIRDGEAIAEVMQPLRELREQIDIVLTVAKRKESSGKSLGDLQRELAILQGRVEIDLGRVVGQQRVKLEEHLGRLEGATEARQDMWANFIGLQAEYRLVLLGQAKAAAEQADDNVARGGELGLLDAQRCFLRGERAVVDAESKLVGRGDADNIRADLHEVGGEAQQNYQQLVASYNKTTAAMLSKLSGVHSVAQVQAVLAGDAPVREVEAAETKPSLGKVRNAQQKLETALTQLKGLLNNLQSENSGWLEAICQQLLARFEPLRDLCAVNKKFAYLEGNWRENFRQNAQAVYGHLFGERGIEDELVGLLDGEQVSVQGGYDKAVARPVLQVAVRQAVLAAKELTSERLAMVKPEQLYRGIFIKMFNDNSPVRSLNLQGNSEQARQDRAIVYSYMAAVNTNRARDYADQLAMEGALSRQDRFASRLVSVSA